MISNADSALLRTFATLADSLVDDFDVLDILQTLVDACTDLLDVSAAGILLLGADGHLDLAASTNEANRTVELMQLSAQAGPCIESFRTGRMVAVPDLADAPPSWSAFRDSALQQGFAATYAIPLRLRQTTIGALNLMNTGDATMEDHHVLLRGPLPTSPRSPSCRNGPSASTTLSPASSRPPSTRASSSSRPRASPPTPTTPPSRTPSRSSATTPAPTASPSARSPTPSFDDSSSSPLKRHHHGRGLLCCAPRS